MKRREIRKILDRGVCKRGIVVLVERHIAQQGGIP
jgi:hypothetical protein